MQVAFDVRQGALLDKLFSQAKLLQEETENARVEWRFERHRLMRLELPLQASP